MRLWPLLCFVCLVFCTSVLLSSSVLASEIKGVRIGGTHETTRVVFDLAAASPHKVKRLTSPHRLEIELTRISNQQLPSVSGSSALVKKISSAKSSAGTALLVIELTKPVSDSVFSLPPTAPYGHRLVVDLKPLSAHSHSEAVSASSPALTTPAKDVTPMRASGRDIIIAIDAGHGGNDPGAVGPKGSHEKRITLAVSKFLQQQINQQPGLKAVLTRSSDYYIHPGKRPELARQKQADLLISIHADAVDNRKAHGASVWVLSMRRATTEVGRMLEQTEQHSELLGGVAEVIKDSANERYLAQTVLDLSMNHSMVTGYEVAKEVLKEMGKVAHLHKKEPQAASLAVLKAPDIPSILVETGFISNHNEERLLNDVAHQKKLANAIFNAVTRYFSQQPPADSLFATLKQQGKGIPLTTSTTQSKSSLSGLTHKVKAGESLSKLARHYGVSMAELRQHNKLKDDTIKVGQVLRIP